MKKSKFLVLIFQLLFFSGCYLKSNIADNDNAASPSPSPAPVLPTIIDKLFLFGADQGATKKIACYEFDNTTGAMVLKSQTPVIGLGNLVVTHPSKSFIYALTWDGSVPQVYGFSVAVDCTLTSVPNSPITLAVAGYHESLAMHPSGNFLYIAEDDSYVEGLAIDQQTGALSFTPGNPYFVATNVWPMSVSFSSGAGNYLYSANQGDTTIGGFSVNLTTGALTHLPGSPFSGASGAYWISIFDGFLVSADREINAGWTSFAIDGTGVLSNPTFLAGGISALQGAISSDGKVILSADDGTDKIEVVLRNLATGAISRPTPSGYSIGVKTSGVTISPNDKFAIATATTAQTITVFSLNTSTGALSLVNSSSVAPAKINGLSFGSFTY